MKNYYVMNSKNQMVHRNTLNECRRWAEFHTNQWKQFGMRPEPYRIFYDTGTEPVETFNETRNEE